MRHCSLTLKSVWKREIVPLLNRSVCSVLFCFVLLIFRLPQPVYLLYSSGFFPLKTNGASLFFFNLRSDSATTFRLEHWKLIIFGKVGHTWTENSRFLNPINQSINRAPQRRTVALMNRRLFPPLLDLPNHDPEVVTTGKEIEET